MWLIYGLHLSLKQDLWKEPCSRSSREKITKVLSCWACHDPSSHCWRACKPWHSPTVNVNSHPSGPLGNLTTLETSKLEAAQTSFSTLWGLHHYQQRLHMHCFRVIETFQLSLGSNGSWAGLLTFATPWKSNVGSSGKYAEVWKKRLFLYTVWVLSANPWIQLLHSSRMVSWAPAFWNMVTTLTIL